MKSRLIISLVLLFFLVFMTGCKDKEVDWEKEYTISYNCDGGTAVSLTILNETTLNTFEVKETTYKEGYTFIGWFLDIEKTIPYVDIIQANDYFIETSENCFSLTLFALFSEIKEFDNVLPIITYNGNKGINLTVSKYEDIDFLEGIYAVDNVDGDITKLVKVESPSFDGDMKLSSEALGLCYVFYTVTDSSGNTSVPFVRQYNVLDIPKGDIILSWVCTAKNQIRYSDYLVLYTYKKSSIDAPQSTNTNGWGLEVAIDKDGYVIEVDTNCLIPVDGYVLSGNGKGKDIISIIEVGDMASINEKDLTFTIVRNEEIKQEFQANKSIENARNAYELSLSRGIDCNRNLIEEKFKDIEKSLNLIKSKELNKREISSQYVLIQSIATDIIYMSSFSRSLGVNACWHRPNATGIETNVSGIIKTLDYLKKSGINVIFLETLWNGYTSYNSKILDVHPKISNFKYEGFDDDYVKAFITLAHERNIEVHSWCHVFNAGSASYKSDKVKDEYLSYDYENRLLHPNIYGGVYFYDPTNKEVIELLSKVMLEMATDYDFDGIQYDYIRYYDNDYTKTPFRDSGFTTNSETLFKQKYNLNGDVRDLIKTKSIRDKWIEFRKEIITNAVKTFTNVIRNANKEIVISASVAYPLNNAINTYCQDWATWALNKDIDMLCPMIYTGSSESVRTNTISIQEIVGNNVLVVSGISPTYNGYSVSQAFSQFEVLNICSGYAYFASHNILQDLDLTNCMKLGPSRNEIISPFKPTKEILEFVLNKLIKDLNEIYLPNELIKEITVSKMINCFNSILNNNLSIEDDIDLLNNILKNDELKDYAIVNDINILVQVLKFKVR